MNVIGRLKELNLDREDVDELIAAKALTAGMRQQYSAFQVDVPSWLSEVDGKLDREIGRRHRDALEQRLSQIERERTGLETASERRERLDREAAAVKALLAK